jgi:hypothetical protein
LSDVIAVKEGVSEETIIIGAHYDSGNVGAHEPHFIGSAHYVKQMAEAERAKTIVVVTVDGLLAGDNAYVYGGDGEGQRTGC